MLPMTAMPSAAFVDGIHTGLLYAAGAALLAAITVTILLSPGLRSPRPASSEIPADPGQREDAADRELAPAAR